MFDKNYSPPIWLARHMIHIQMISGVLSIQHCEFLLESIEKYFDNIDYSWDEERMEKLRKNIFQKVEEIENILKDVKIYFSDDQELWNETWGNLV